MTATAATTGMSGIHPAMTARYVLWGTVLVNVAIVQTLFFTSAPSKNDVIGVAKFVGLHVALTMVLQLVLVSRLPWLDRRIGMDQLTSWHRWTGFTLFWLVLLHPTLILIGYSTLDRLTVFQEIKGFSRVFPTLMGMIAVGVIVVAVAFSVAFLRRRLAYEVWHGIHLLLYGAVTLAVIHQVYEGSSFRSSGAATVYWWSLWAFAIGSLLIGRVIMPFVRNARHRLRVSAVVPESENVVSVHVTGRDLHRLNAKAGQFFIWRFLGHGRWWEANPFSLSAAPDGQSLRLTAKAVGRTSARLRHVPVGTRVFVEGPYGALTPLQQTRDRALLIAGGIGVTPIRALLQDLQGDVVVLYRVRSMSDAVLLAELEELSTSRGASLHVLSGRTGDGSPPNLPFEPENLAALVPDVTERDIFVCGPPAMSTAVIRNLRRLGVPRPQIHAERFALAG